MAREIHVWPEPYLQPDRKKDCGYYAAAYIARCLGHPEVTAERVKAWRAETMRHETYFADHALGAVVRRSHDECLRRLHDYPQYGELFGLGLGSRDWVTDWLSTGWIAHVNIHRIPDMGHAVALLGCSDDGALLMDPIYGHITEPWGWFLGPGARKGRDKTEWPGVAPDGRAFHGCHFIEGWYRRG